MADMLIKIEADATGWHDNLCCETPYLTDGWAVVPLEIASMVRDLAGIVMFEVGTASMADYPDIVDRRTVDRGQPYPVATQMMAGTYVPPPKPPEPEYKPDPEPTPTLYDRVTELEGDTEELHDALDMILTGYTGEESANETGTAG